MGTGQIGQSPEMQARFFYGYVVVIMATCVQVVTLAAFTAFGIFFNPIITEFGWTRAATSSAISLAMVSFSLLGIVMGRLNDKFGPRLVLTIGGCLLGLGYWLLS